MSTRADKFKDSEIGLIPDTWSVKCIKELAAVRYGRARPGTKGSIPAIGSGGVYAWVDKPLVEFPTIVIGRKGTAGKAWLYKEPCWPSDTTFYLDWTREVDIDFLYGYLRLNPLSGEHAKTTLPSLQKPDLEAYKLPFPPLPEQKRIAHVLSTIQQAIEEQDRVLNAARELKRSVMHRLFTYGPYAEELPTKETEIGLIPAEWGVVPLQKIVENTETRNPSAEPEKGFRYIDVSSISNEIFRIEEWKDLLGQDAPSRARKVVKAGDTIFATVRPYLRNIAQVPQHLDNSICSTGFCVLRAKRGYVDPDFLYHTSLSDSFVEGIVAHQKGSSYPAVSDTVVLNQPIPLPPMNEQHRIGHFLNTVQVKITAEKKRMSALEEVFRSMLHHLMTGQIRVNNLEVEL